MRPVLYYVHHHGQGHWRRALAVAAGLTRPVVFASSAPPPQALPALADFLELPADFPAPPGDGSAQAHGRLHWAPLGHAGLLRRHHLLLTEAVRRQVVLAVVDVSVEVTVLLRTSGIPVVAVRQPGQRSDPAHQLAYALADQVVMPVPARWGLHQGLARTRAVGLLAASGPGPDLALTGTDRPRVLVVVGAGGSRLGLAQCERIAVELPDHEVRVLGLAAPTPGGAARGRPSPVNLTFAGRIQDPRAELRSAAVIVGNTGLGTVGDVAAAARPFVALPEERPFGEQQATAAALHAGREAVVLLDLPAPGGWRTAVLQAADRGPSLLGADGAARFAELLERRARVSERGTVAVRPRTPVAR